MKAKFGMADENYTTSSFYFTLQQRQTWQRGDTATGSNYKHNRHQVELLDQRRKTRTLVKKFLDTDFNERCMNPKT